MRRFRLGVLLATASLGAGVFSVTGAAPAQGAVASVVPARTVAVTSRHTGYTTLRALALVNMYRGATVAVSASESSGAAEESLGSSTAGPSGYVNLASRVRGLRFRSGARVLMAIVYTPAGAAGERYAKTISINFTSRGSPSIRNECSLTFAGTTVTECRQPCPAPAGISVKYCAGLGTVLHFQASFPYASGRRSVRLRDLRVNVLHLGSSIAVFCARGRSGSCPPFAFYPNLQTHHINVLELLRRPLTVGTSIDIVLYKGNYTGHSIRLDVVAGNPPFIKARRLCNYPDLNGPRRCTRSEG